MESCDADVLEIGGDEVDTNKTSTSVHQLTAKVETDYRVHLVERTHCATDSDYDTDDLIEDARNFVITAESKLVDMSDWADIDEKRRTRRQKRKTDTRRKGTPGGRSKTSSLGSDGDQGEDELDCQHKSSAPYLPRRQCELRPGFPVRLLSLIGSRITPGVVRYLGPNDQVGVELRERLGGCDGSSG